MVTLSVVAIALAKMMRKWRGNGADEDEEEEKQHEGKKMQCDQGTIEEVKSSEQEQEERQSLLTN